ncbi:hypothetical protein ACQUSR_31170 [Streptomyces sp. P1-3]|uniref:hypothetical protein n=1 Tax=Streptomyces sp. P1-3 TaxID=3421658 RepID=UPI003D35C8D6
MSLVRGSSRDALEWIDASELTTEQKSELARFVNRFPTLTYSRASRELLDDMENRHGVRIPGWLRTLSSAVALIGDFPEFQVESYAHWTPRMDHVDPGWYTSEWGYANEQERQSFVQAGMYPIALWIEDALSYLAVNIADEHDQRIFEFTGEDISDDLRNSLPADSSVFPVYDSYTEMVSRIVQLRMPDGSVVEAR